MFIAIAFAGFRRRDIADSPGVHHAPTHSPASRPDISRPRPCGSIAGAATVRDLPEQQGDPRADPAAQYQISASGGETHCCPKHTFEVQEGARTEASCPAMTWATSSS